MILTRIWNASAKIFLICVISLSILAFFGESFALISFIKFPSIRFDRKFTNVVQLCVKQIFINFASVFLQAESFESHFLHDSAGQRPDFRLPRNHRLRYVAPSQSHLHISDGSGLHLLGRTFPGHHLVL